jgi:hypothetical protein
MGYDRKEINRELVARPGAIHGDFARNHGTYD